MQRNFERCLVVRNYGHIGDLLMSTPALKELSKRYLVDIVIPKQYSDVFYNLNFIQNIFFEEPDHKDYARVFDLSDYEFNYEQIYQPEIYKTKQELFAEALGVKINSSKPLINLTPEEIRWIKSYLKGVSKKILVLAPKSSNPTRDWPLEKWIELIGRIKRLNYQIVIVDKSLRWEDPDIIFFNNRSLRQVFSLVYLSDFVVSNDSGLLHIAAAFDKPCLGIFGPTDPKMRAIYSKSYAVQLNIPCAPCWYARCDHLTCLNSLSVDVVENKLLEMIQNEIGTGII